MRHNDAPTLRNGKICYLEIPATDIDRSVRFYKAVFGWNTRVRDNGQVAFNDTVNEVSGTWVAGHRPMTEVGLLIYIMVDDINKTLVDIIQNGGIIVQPVGMDAPELTARFSDPAGNILGIYQERG